MTDTTETEGGAGPTTEVPASIEAMPSAALVLDGLVKRFGPVVAVDGVSLEIPPGALVSFLGPSGCGKTTLLRMLAGLERPTAGSIVLGGADVTRQAAHQRDIGMVFQSLALFPHLDVRRNIGYPLRIKGTDRRTIASRVDELLGLVHLDGLGRRPVRKLSGGQRQRVAIARALACEPSLFLLDEPMSALDANLREALQVELRLLQQRLGITTIMVTHDQREAMTMSDVVVVMNDGRVEQAGPPLEVYRQPSTAFVARFMGATNLLPAKVHGPDDVKVGGRHPVRRPLVGARQGGGRRRRAVAAARRRHRAGRRRHRAGGARHDPGRGGVRPRPRHDVRVLRRLRARRAARRLGRGPRPPRRGAGRHGRGPPAARPLRGGPAVTRGRGRGCAADERERLTWGQRAILWVPVALLAVFFLVPFGLMLATSFYRRIEGGFYEPGFVFDSWSRLFSDVYIGRTLFSLRLCLLVALLTTTVAFPFTWFLTRMRARAQVPLLVSCSGR